MHRLVTTALVIALGISPAAAAQAVAQAAPSASATLKDARGDGESRAFDIHWMTGWRAGSQLVLVMKVDDITRGNTAPLYGDNTSTLRAIFGFHLRVNGQAEPRYMLARGGWNGDEAVVRRSDTKERVDCTPGVGGPLGTARPGSLRLHPRKDTVRFLVPLSCLPGVRTVSFTGYTADSRAGSPRTDHAYRRGTEVSRWSRWFAVR